MTNRLKDIGIRFVLVISSSLFALLLIELAVRALNLYSFPTDDFIQSHPELGWSHIPNKEGYSVVGKERIYVKINSKGLRDWEYPYQKKIGVFRVLVLGDSFTEAFQVPLEDSFCKVLESELNRTQEGFEVINAGFTGVGTDYQLLFFRAEGHKYQPDLVILAFFANDIYDNYRSKQVSDDTTAPLAYERKGLITRLKTLLAKRSCAYNYFGYVLPKHVPLLANLLMRLGILSFQPIDDAKGVDQLHYLVFLKEYGPEWKRAWDVTQVLISALKKETEQRSTSLAVVSIPFREQVYKNLWQSRLSRPGMSRREWDLNKPDRLLARFLNDAGIPFLQLLPHLKKAADKSELYHSEDGHWNVGGHHLAAQVICDWLTKERLVPIEARN